LALSKVGKIAAVWIFLSRLIFLVFNNVHLWWLFEVFTILFIKFLTVEH